MRFAAIALTAFLTAVSPAVAGLAPVPVKTPSVTGGSPATIIETDHFACVIVVTKDWPNGYVTCG